MKTATVKRPEFDDALSDHPSVKLTAKVTHGLVSAEYDLKLKVKMKGVTDSQSVILDLTDLKIPKTTKESLILPTLGKNGSTITWKSSDPAIDANGVVERPKYDALENKVVTLTATCAKGSESQTTTFEVTVVKWELQEEVDIAKTFVNWDLIRGINTNSQAITDNLMLPAMVGRDVVATWSIVSSSAGSGSLTGKLEITTGVITRPTHTQGQVSIQIKCSLAKGGKTHEVILSPFILAPAAMTDAEVLAATVTLLESSKFLGVNASLTQIKDDMQLPFRLKEADASRATIAWSLVAATAHTPVASSPYIALSNTAEYMLADITQPTSSSGNVSIALKATITVNALTESKYFDMTILTTVL